MSTCLKRKKLTTQRHRNTWRYWTAKATPKYNPTICESLGITPLDGYTAIEG